MRKLLRRIDAPASTTSTTVNSGSVCTCGCCRRWEPLAKCVLTTLRITRDRVQRYGGPTSEIELVMAEVERALGQ